jgi:hypothetical protein
VAINTFLAEKLCHRWLPACLFVLCVTHTNGDTGGGLLKGFRARSIAAEAVYWGVCGALSNRACVSCAATFA